MAFSTTQRTTQSNLAHQFPSFQINAKDVRRGAVKVEARAPSGRVHEMSVIDNNGVYTANFTPTEVGTYKLSHWQYNFGSYFMAFSVYESKLHVPSFR